MGLMQFRTQKLQLKFETSTNFQNLYKFSDNDCTAEIIVDYDHRIPQLSMPIIFSTQAFPSKGQFSWMLQSVKVTGYINAGLISKKVLVNAQEKKIMPDAGPDFKIMDFYTTDNFGGGFVRFDLDMDQLLLSINEQKFTLKKDETYYFCVAMKHKEIVVDIKQN